MSFIYLSFFSFCSRKLHGFSSPSWFFSFFPSRWTIIFSFFLLKCMTHSFIWLDFLLCHVILFFGMSPSLHFPLYRFPSYADIYMYRCKVSPSSLCLFLPQVKRFAPLSHLHLSFHTFSSWWCKVCPCTIHVFFLFLKIRKSLLYVSFLSTSLSYIFFPHIQVYREMQLRLFSIYVFLSFL